MLASARTMTNQGSALYTYIPKNAFEASLTGFLKTHLTLGSLLAIAWPLALLLVLVVLFYVLKTLLEFLRYLVASGIDRFSKTPEKIFLELTFPADTSKSAYATSQLYTLLHTLASQHNFLSKFLRKKITYSLEIVSNKEQGIRYILVSDKKNAEVIKRSLLAYLPGIRTREVKDYLSHEPDTSISGISELKLGNHFALPLEDQKTLKEHDPISYLTSQMTKLGDNELISFQVVITPVLKGFHNETVKRMREIRKRMLFGEELAPALSDGFSQKMARIPGINVIWFLTRGIFLTVKFLIMFIYSMFLAFMDPNSKVIPFLMTTRAINDMSNKIVQSPYEQELRSIVKEKIDQQLFESSMRVLIYANSNEDYNSRISGLMASFGLLDNTFQTISTKSSLLPISLRIKKRLNQFVKRALSNDSPFNKNPILSISELSDIYHFPYTDTTKTEDLAKLHSIELPAPLSLKNNENKGKLDVVFGKNTYGEIVTDIGLTEEERQTHMYILGRTGSGKTTVMFSMAKHDIKEGRGLAFIDPHGDVAEDLLATIPLDRKNDLIYVNPIDLKYPIGINLLELTKGLDEDDAELEKEVVAEGVISLFRKVFSKDETTNAHRIEYILRNTIYTAFTIEGCTLFTISKILTNPTFRKQVVSKLKDEDLIDFWKYEFGKAGDYQVVKMTQGVTAKVGRFMRSPTAKRILEQSKSTINFDDIINNGKILICNFSQGKLGEDTSRLLGTTILTKLQQAALKRAYIPQSKRKIFYLFVDEFQTFATQAFTKMVTEGRKYKMPLIIAEQSTSQQHDRDITNTILANITTVISFRSGNYIDEDLMLNQFRPYLEKGAIMNLPRYRFYIKISAIESEEPFSGETIYTPVKKDFSKIKKLTDASRKNWAIVYQRKQEDKESGEDEEVTAETSDNPKKVTSKSGLPEKRNR